MPTITIPATIPLPISVRDPAEPDYRTDALIQRRPAQRHFLCKGIHNIKLGGVYSQTFLRENDTLGVVNNTSISPCMDVNGKPRLAIPRRFAPAGIALWLMGHSID